MPPVEFQYTLTVALAAKFVPESTVVEPAEPVTEEMLMAGPYASTLEMLPALPAVLLLPMTA